MAQAAPQLMRSSCCRVCTRPSCVCVCVPYTKGSVHQGRAPIHYSGTTRRRGKGRDCAHHSGSAARAQGLNSALTSVVHLRSAGSGTSLRPSSSLLRRFTLVLLPPTSTERRLPPIVSREVRRVGMGGRPNGYPVVFRYRCGWVGCVHVTEVQVGYEL